MFGGLAFGDIRHHREYDGVILADLVEAGTGQHPHFGAIRAPQTAIQLFPHSDAAILKPYAFDGQVFGEKKIVQAPALDLACRASENLRHARVGMTDHSIGIDHPDAFARSFDKMLLPVFALCRAIFREPKLPAIKAQDNSFSPRTER